MRILTVRQPWAWAIVFGGKDVENRSRNIAGAYRGPVLIHAGLRAVDHTDPIWDRDDYLRALSRARATDREHLSVRGAIIGVADLVDVHAPHVGVRAVGHGSAGGVSWGTWAGCGDWADPDAWHLVFKNPRALDRSVPSRGGLGLRRAHNLEVVGDWFAELGDRCTCYGGDAVHGHEPMCGWEPIAKLREVTA